jgi:hypothetical protein
MRTAMAAELEGGKPRSRRMGIRTRADRTKSQIRFGYNLSAEVEH